MRSSKPDEQFVTSLKNGKLGVLREQSTRSHLLFLLAGEQDLWQTEYGSVGVGSLEMLFHEQQETLLRATVKFSLWEGVQPWQKRLNLMWLDGVASKPFDSVVAALAQAELPFQVLEFRDGGRGVLRVKLPATVMLMFDSGVAPA